MERCFLEDGFCVSVLGVAIFCEVLTLCVGCKCRTQEVHRFLLGILLATTGCIVLLCCSSMGHTTKLMLQYRGIKFSNQLNKIAFKDSVKQIVAVWKQSCEFLILLSWRDGVHIPSVESGQPSRWVSPQAMVEVMPRDFGGCHMRGTASPGTLGHSSWSSKQPDTKSFPWEDTMSWGSSRQPMWEKHMEKLFRLNQEREMPGQFLFDWNERPQAKTAYLNLLQIPNPQTLPEIIKCLLLL